MRLKYYSYYPYEDPEYKVVPRTPKKGDSNLSKHAVDLAFRLYPAALCESMKEVDAITFVEHCFEAMDRPDARLDYCPGDISYQDKNYDVIVVPTEHFYGATNSNDGVYVVEENGVERFFTIDSLDGVEEHKSWKNAIYHITHSGWHIAEGYTKGIDYTRYEK